MVIAAVTAVLQFFLAEARFGASNDQALQRADIWKNQQN
jgi:hypothetical protein